MLLSGGIDSATCAYWARKKFSVRALTFSYHGIAGSELRAARAIGKSSGAQEHKLVRLPDLREAQDIGKDFGGLPPTYIPMRNAVFYSLAASYAEVVQADFLVGGHNKDDLRTFRDTSQTFFRALECSFVAGSSVLKTKGLRILRPLKGKTKPQVIRFAASLGLPFELTWSCHSDGDRHCWNCHGCFDRRVSFMKARVVDPLDSGT